MLQVGESSLYPALQRLLLNGFVDAEWGPSGEQPARALLLAHRRGHKSNSPPSAPEFDRLVTAIHRRISLKSRPSAITTIATIATIAGTSA